MATNATIFVFIESDGVIVIFSAGQQAAGQWSGQGAQSYGVRLLGATSAATRVAGADGQMSGQLAAAASTAGQASSTVSRIAARTDGGVAALAPTTDTAAGRAALAAHLERQLDAVQSLVNNGQLHDARSGRTSGRPHKAMR